MNRVLFVAVYFAMIAGCASRPEGDPVNYSAVAGPKDGAVAFRAIENLRTYNSVSQDDQQKLAEGAGLVIPRNIKLTVLSEEFDPNIRPESSDDRNNRDCFVKEGHDDEQGEWTNCSDIVPISPMSTSSAKPGAGEMLTLDQAQDMAIQQCQSRFGLTFKRMDAAPDTEIGDYPNQDQRLVIINCGHPGDDLWRGNGVHDFFIDRTTHKAMTEDEWYHTTPCKLWDKDRTSAWCQSHPKQ